MLTLLIKSWAFHELIISIWHLYVPLDSNVLLPFISSLIKCLIQMFVLAQNTARTGIHILYCNSFNCD